MKKRVFLLWLLILCSALYLKASEPGGRLEILFTGDIHSSGSYTALYQRVKEAKESALKEGRALIVVDCGDIAMGSLFHALYQEQAFELTTMAKCGYDAFTVGNHDFDFGVAPFLEMLQRAKALGAGSCKLTVANIAFKDRGQDSLFNLYNNRYIILEREGVEIALFGLLGEDAYSCIADNEAIIWEEPIEAAQKVVSEIMSAHNPDYIVALSHGGIMWAGKKRVEEGISNELKLRAKTEDGLLARALPKIDVIISGHDHQALSEPVVLNSSVIVAAGSHNRYIGRLQIEKDSIIEYVLEPLSQKEFLVSKEFNAWVDSAKILVYKLFKESDNVNIFDTIAFLQSPPKANHVALSYAMAAEKYLNKRAVAVVPYGMIRKELKPGAVTYGDIFEMLALGRVDEYSYGTNLVYGYVKGGDLEDLCELNATVARSETIDEHLFFAGIEYGYNRYRLPLTRVKEVTIYGEPLKRDSLYLLVADNYTANLMGLVASSSFGLLSVIPRDSTGIAASFNILPIKGWIAFANYLKNGEATELNIVNAKEKSTPAVILLYIVAVAAILAILLRLFGRQKRNRLS